MEEPKLQEIISNITAIKWVISALVSSVASSVAVIFWVVRQTWKRMSEVRSALWGTEGDDTHGIASRLRVLETKHEVAENSGGCNAGRRKK